MILKPHGTLKQRLTITSGQIACILGLEGFLQAHGFILVCPRCLLDAGDPFLQTDNSPQAREFKIDCQCRERRIAAEDVGRAMDANGDLMASAEQILGPLSLAVRCPEGRCLKHPLEIERTLQSTIIRCRCAKTTLHPPRPIVH